MPASDQTAGRSRWPSEVRLLRGRKTLRVSYDDGLEATIPVSLLRVYSPSAEVQGHRGGSGFLVADKSAVTVQSIERVGSYAIRLLFSDGHDSGFYSWAFLEDFALSLEQRQAAYDAAMASAHSG